MARSIQAAMERKNTARHRAASHTRVAKIKIEKRIVTKIKSTSHRVVKITRVPIVIKIVRGLIGINIKVPVALLRIKIEIRRSIIPVIVHQKHHRHIRAQRKTKNVTRQQAVTHHQKIRTEEIVTSTKLAAVLAQKNIKVKTKIVKRNAIRININRAHQRTNHRLHITRIQVMQKLSPQLSRNLTLKMKLNHQSENFQSIVSDSICLKIAHVTTHCHSLKTKNLHCQSSLRMNTKKIILLSAKVRWMT